MPETKNKKIQIKLAFFSNLALKAIALINRLLVLLQLREKRRYWGIVYDSVTKQPLDPVQVSLIYADTGKVEDRLITDLEGRYGFLARPGKFKIFVQRTNYTFPAQQVLGDSDGIYSHLYHGEFFNLTEDSEVVAPNIPMDPVGPDWNQKAKKRLVFKAFYLEWFFEKLTAVFLWFGFIYVSIWLVLNNFKFSGLRTLFFAYFGLFCLELITPPLRLWGKVAHGENDQPIFGLRLQLVSPQLPGVVFGSAISREGGRFFLRANPGGYILKIFHPTTGKELASAPVRVGPEGVLNQKVVINNFL